MLPKDLNLEYDLWSLQRRLEEGLTFTRSACTDALEIIHKPVENWDLDRLAFLIDELRAEGVIAAHYAAALMEMLDDAGWRN